MSFFDGNARSPVSAGVSRVGVAQYDAGLRAYMLGIYNHMTLGLAISAVVALGAFMMARSNPSVAYIEWIDPLMAGGNWMPELVEMAGGVNLFGEAGKHSPWMTWEELVAKDPDIMFVSPCGFDIQRTLQEMHLLGSKPEWKSLKAVAGGRVVVADGNQYFNRPGPRLVQQPVQPPRHKALPPFADGLVGYPKLVRYRRVGITGRALQNHARALRQRLRALGPPRPPLQSLALFYPQAQRCYRSPPPHRLPSSLYERRRRPTIYSTYF